MAPDMEQAATLVDQIKQACQQAHQVRRCESKAKGRQPSLPVSALQEVLEMRQPAVWIYLEGRRHQEEIAAKRKREALHRAGVGESGLADDGSRHRIMSSARISKALDGDTQSVLEL